jgi:hypothetical protein
MAVSIKYFVMKTRGAIIVLSLVVPAIFLVFINLGNSTTITSIFGNSKLNDVIAELGKDSVIYEEVRVPSDKPILVTENTIFIRVIISGVGCSTCFEELVAALNSFTDLSDDRILSLVLTNPHRNSAFQLKRMHGIKVPLYIADDERLKEIGREFGSAYIFSSGNAKPIYNLSPIRSALDIINYIEQMHKKP